MKPMHIVDGQWVELTDRQVAAMDAWLNFEQPPDRDEWHEWPEGVPSLPAVRPDISATNAHCPCPNHIGDVCPCDHHDHGDKVGS